nr:nuclear transport factor 2 family protein [uncultured Psychroserpens sp.]
MKHIIGVLTILFLNSHCFAQNAKDIAQDKQKVITVFEDFFSALKVKDKDELRQILHDSFLLTSSDSNGEFLNKEQYIWGACNPDIIQVKAYDLYDYNITIYENVAILRCRIDWESTYKGKPWNASFLNTDIFVFEAGHWKIISRHSSYPANQLKKIVGQRYSD